MPIVIDKPLDATDIRRIISGANKPRHRKASGNDFGRYTFFAHGISKQCDSIEEALKTFGIDWTVRTVELKSHNNDDPEFNDIDFLDHRGVVREDNMFPLSTVGAKIYTPIQNYEVMEIVKTIVDSGELIIESGGVFDYGKRIWIACRLPESVEINFSTEKQTILRYVHLSWSHDQTQAVTVSFMPFIAERKVSLASMVPSGAPSSISFRHTKTAGERMSKGAGIMKKALKFFADAQEMLQQMATESITPEKFREMLDFLYPNPEEEKFNKDGKKKISSNEKTRREIIDRWEKLPADIQFTKYGALIATAENADFDGRSVVRGVGNMTEDDKLARQREKRLDSSLFGTAQKKKQVATKVIFNFDKMKESGGITT